MPLVLSLGKWIREKHKSQVAFAHKLGVDPTRLSRWLNLSDGISQEYQAKIRKLGYQGPWPAEEKAPLPNERAGYMASHGTGSSTGQSALSDANTLAGGPYLTMEAFAEWRGYWKAGMEGVLERIERLEAQVRKLSQPEEKP